MDSGSVQTDFFLPGITLNLMYICYALDNGFLNPLIHLIFILIEPITAKDIAASKRWGSRSLQVFSDRWIIRTLRILPGCLKHIGGVVYPLRARLVIEVTQVFDRCSAKSCPTTCFFAFLLWLT